ncbi:MAG: hypothetical protein OXU36_10520 [Candidatus Poribacteria bacterium]|nr:hypothetical protein [Candidatus Poribacteria bacterium]
MTEAILSIVGGILPHLSDILGLFGKSKDDQTQDIADKSKDIADVELQGLRELPQVLQYPSIRILFIVTTSVVVTLWAVSQIHNDLVNWSMPDHGMLYLVGSTVVSAAFKTIKKII